MSRIFVPFMRIPIKPTSKIRVNKTWMMDLEPDPWQFLRIKKKKIPNKNVSDFRSFHADPDQADVGNLDQHNMDLEPVQRMN